MNVTDTWRLPLPFKNQYPSHIEISQLICRANQLTGFHTRETLVVKGLNIQKLLFIFTSKQGQPGNWLWIFLASYKF